MDMGTHDYSEAQRVQARQATEASLAAVRRDNLPTLAEAIAASDMVLTPEGHLMPKRVADRGDRGWDGADGAAADRDSGQAAKLAQLVRQMDQMTWDVLTGKQLYSAVRLANQWSRIREITQGNQADRSGQADQVGQGDDNV